LKDKLITQIQVRMASTLNMEQLEELRRVLTYAFDGVDITEKEALEPTDATDNGGMLDVFIAAKRIEGCSDKSLKYYTFTVRQMLNSIGKHFREISTDDLRGYLADYQKDRGS